MVELSSLLVALIVLSAAALGGAVVALACPAARRERSPDPFAEPFGEVIARARRPGDAP
jgi:hypothetical protein